MTQPTHDGARPAPADRPATVLVLGGGGLKGVAHIGALRALEEAGVRPDAIIGTSIGSLVGALAAAGVSVDELAERARTLGEDDILQLNRWVAWIRGLKQQSVYVGDRLKEYIRDALPVERFEDLSVPFRLNTVSLNTGRQVWFGAGARTDLPLADAIYASSALPVHFPPLSVNGDVLVDGGVLDPLPIRAALDWAADRVIAVNVSADFEVASAEPWLDHGIVGIHQRVMEVKGERARRMIPSPDMSRVVLVRPEIGHLGTFEFGHAEFAMERGHAAMMAALEDLAAEPTAPDGRVRSLWTRVKRVVRVVVPTVSGPPQPADGRTGHGEDGARPAGPGGRQPAQRIEDGPTTEDDAAAGPTGPTGKRAEPGEELVATGGPGAMNDRER